MSPHFKKATVDILAKRAAYKCSNPDCRVNTISPNSDPNKTTIIGEACHIFAAKKGAKRYNENMSNQSRADITNGIWLCRNCHKLIDTDDKKYTSNLLFIWREKHEEFIYSTIGNKTEKILYEERVSSLKDFSSYPPIVKRIVIDKPLGWEYRLAAELMKYLNEPIFRQLRDLRNGLYLKKIESVNSESAYEWIQDRISELSVMVKPATGLLKLLTESFGKPGEEGDIYEIHHATKLIKNYLSQILLFEEKVYFVNVPEEYEKLVMLLRNLIGSQVEKLSLIPSDLEDVLTIMENTDESELPKEIRKEIVFEVPYNWEKRFSEELDKVTNQKNKISEKSSNSCLSTLVYIVLIILIIIFYM